jgi:lysophospholipase L1-like esterase
MQEAVGPRVSEWRPVPDEPASEPGIAGSVLGPVVIALVLLLLGVRTLAAVVVVLGLGTFLLGLVWPPFARGMAHVLRAVAHVVAAGLSAVLMGFVAAIVLVPAGLVLRLLRRDPLTFDGVRRGWHQRPPALRSLPRQTYGQERADPVGARATAWRLVQVGTTVVVVLLVLDLAAGMVWDRTLGNPDSGPALLGVAPSPGPSGGQPRERSVDTSGRAELPAMADAPWAEQYFYELDTMPFRFDPYLVNRAYPFDGEHITTTEDTRLSYLPPDLPVDAPVIWFFGGSTTFGEGQRDEHTIPSEVARLAQAAGTPIRVENFGQRGWVIWQELLQLERQLAVQEAPDLVVFYDGANEINTIAEQGGEQPTVYNADDHRATIEGGVVDAASGEVVRDESLGRQVWDWWRKRSLVAEIARQARGAVEGRAAAEEVAQGDAGTDLSDEAKAAAVPAAVDVYVRGREVVLDLASDHDVEPAFFWQAEADSVSEDSPMRQAARLVGEPTIDLSLTFQDVALEDVFIDGGHTNELGAQMVAEAMWVHLDEIVADLHVER